MGCKILVCLVGLIVCAHVLAQPSYRVQPLGGLEPMGTWGYAIDGHYAGGTTAFANDQRQFARLWNIQTGTFVDLNPPGYLRAGIRAIAGRTQLGWRSTSGNHRACFWRSTPESCVELHPKGFVYSDALGGDSNLQVGWGERADGRYVGLAWRGTRESVVTMLPTGYASSFCLATENGRIVGHAGSYSAPSGAALWSSTNPDDFIILPTVGRYPYGGGEASDIRGEFIVGFASLAFYPYIAHAAVWRGPKHVFYDLHDSSWRQSQMTSTNGVQHVGIVTPDLNSSATHAILWTGTNRQFVDLHQYLPPGQFWSSEAWGILPDGTVIGTAYRQSYWQPTAVVWIPGG